MKITDNDITVIDEILNREEDKHIQKEYEDALSELRKITALYDTSKKKNLVRYFKNNSQFEHCISAGIEKKRSLLDMIAEKHRLEKDYSSLQGEIGDAESAANERKEVVKKRILMPILLLLCMAISSTVLYFSRGYFISSILSQTELGPLMLWLLLIGAVFGFIAGLFMSLFNDPGGECAKGSLKLGVTTGALIGLTVFIVMLSLDESKVGIGIIIIMFIMFIIVCAAGGLAGGFLGGGVIGNILALMFKFERGPGPNILVLLICIAFFGFSAFRFGSNIVTKVYNIQADANYLKTPAVPEQSTAIVINETLNLRSQGNAGSNIVKVLKKGDVLNVTGKNNNGWLPVEHNGDSGWVSSELVTIQNAASKE
jgi:hypothetical protein